jgi:S1-C subfamily serine protease
MRTVVTCTSGAKIKLPGSRQDHLQIVRGEGLLVTDRHVVDPDQLRTQAFDARPVRIIQTQASINPGNSGGGLYDQSVYLLGINTWTTDKSTSEGIGFALAFENLIELVPPPLVLKIKNSDTNGQEGP